MSERLAQIHLHGPLGERFGARHALAVRTPVEAVRALDANYPGFLAAFAAHERYGLFVDGDWRGGDEAALMPFSRELHFCPIIEGQGFVAGLLVTAAFPAITGATATIIGGVLLTGLLIGLSFLLAPKIPKQKDSKDANYAFTGPENVTGQGAAVPLIYGRVHAGTVVVSAGLDLGTDLAPTSPTEASVVPPSTAVQAGLSPPPGGWPAIVDDNQGRPHPTGWRLVSQSNAFLDLLGTKYFLLWQHPTSPRYYWNRARGFYYTTTSTQPNEPDWQDRGHR